MFRNARLTRLARKIESLEWDKRVHYQEFRDADSKGDLEAEKKAWEKMVEIGRKLAKYKKTMRRLEVLS